MKFIRQNMLYLIIFLLFLCKTAFLGFCYYPVLDDYIQFISYHFYVDRWQNIILAGGLHRIRPLAGILDVYLWSNFHANLDFMYFIICMLHFGSYLIFMRAFRKAQIKASMFFTAFYLFLPITVEAAYWLSASTRVIVPLFFCALSLLLIQKEKKVWVFLAAVCNLLSYCFYEQILIVSFILSIVVSYRKNRKYCIIPALNAFLIGIWYIIFSGAGVNNQRSEIALNFSQIGSVMQYLGDIWGKILPQFFIPDSLHIFSYGYVIIVIIFLLCVAMAYYHKSEIYYIKPIEILLPLLLFTFPYVPFMVLKASWPGLRNIMPSVIAAGLFLDLIPLNAIKKYIPPVVIFFSIFSYFTSVINYKQVYETDQKILNILAENNIPHTISVAPVYNKIFPKYGEYIKNITSSDWAITGALRAMTENTNIPLLEITEGEGFIIDKNET